MKTFLVVFTGTAEALEASGWQALTEAQRHERTQSGMAAWQAWMRSKQASIVVAGGPIGTTKRVSPTGMSDAVNNISGYLVVAAESHDQAAQLFEGHPHFTIFPGEAVEIMECLPIPSGEQGS